MTEHYRVEGNIAVDGRRRHYDAYLRALTPEFEELARRDMATTAQLKERHGLGIPITDDAELFPFIDEDAARQRGGRLAHRLGMKAR